MQVKTCLLSFFFSVLLYLTALLFSQEKTWFWELDPDIQHTDIYLVLTVIRELNSIILRWSRSRIT